MADQIRHLGGFRLGAGITLKDFVKLIAAVSIKTALGIKPG